MNSTSKLISESISKSTSEKTSKVDQWVYQWRRPVKTTSESTTIFQIVEPRNFRLYPQRYIHIGDEINCLNIENWLKFLLKKLSTEKNQNSWKFFKIFIFFPKNFFGHLAGHWPANIFQMFFWSWPAIGRPMSGQWPANIFFQKNFQIWKNIKY